ncbi:MAG: hypothetical protein AAF632_20605 [Bacteroidota bacterium]
MKPEKKDNGTTGALMGGGILLLADLLLQQNEINCGQRQKINVGRLASATIFGVGAGYTLGKLPATKRNSLLSLANQTISLQNDGSIQSLITLAEDTASLTS